MARPEKLLSARTVLAATRPGLYADGGGLYLAVDGQGRRRWIWRVSFQGKRRHMGLGAANAVSLAEARGARDRWRETLRAGLDPFAERDKGAEPTVLTFGEVADAFIDAHESSWRNAKHRAQWRMTLTAYCKAIRHRPISDITTAHVLEVLQPIWLSKPETAARLRGRIEMVLDSARAQGSIDEARSNPARWRGHLDKLLPKRTSLSRTHHSAMPFQEVPSFVAQLRSTETVASRALEFLILTATRSSETLNATWSEIDLQGRLWIIPARRMKSAREHRVPLCERAVEILEEVRVATGSHIAYDKCDGDRENSARAKAKEKAVGSVQSHGHFSSFVFPGRRQGRPMSNMVFAMALRRSGLSVTAHGFRSTFRDWCGEATAFPRELAESALAHVVGDATERAYRRGDALERRREMMNTWASYLNPSPILGNVVRLR